MRQKLKYKTRFNPIQKDFGEERQEEYCTCTSVPLTVYRQVCGTDIGYSSCLSSSPSFCSRLLFSEACLFWHLLDSSIYQNQLFINYSKPNSMLSPKYRQCQLHMASKYDNRFSQKVGVIKSHRVCKAIRMPRIGEKLSVNLRTTMNTPLL